MSFGNGLVLNFTYLTSLYNGTLTDADPGHCPPPFVASDEDPVKLDESVLREDGRAGDNGDS